MRVMMDPCNLYIFSPHSGLFRYPASCVRNASLAVHVLCATFAPTATAITTAISTKYDGRRVMMVKNAKLSVPSIKAGIIRSDVSCVFDTTFGGDFG